MIYESLNHWNYIAGAYAFGLGATVLLVGQSWLAMRRAEARRDAVRREKEQGQ